MNRVFINLYLAIEGIIANKLRAFLTALGIIFGVAAVVAMLAIGFGAQQSIMEQMKLIGANTIFITSLTEEDTEGEESSNSGNNDKEWSPGLTMNDLEAIKYIAPTIELSGGEIELKELIIANGKQGKSTVLGIEPSFFELNSLELGSGKNFTKEHLTNGTAVCIVGKSIQAKYFQGEDATGKKLKVGNNWLTVIGVIKRRIANQENLEKLGLKDYNSHVYIPIQTALIRFNDRARVESKDISRRFQNFNGSHNYHQLDRIVLQIDKTKNLQGTAEIVGRYLNRKHQSIKDYEIKIPELLIQQQQKTQKTFNMVLAAIAGISLLVGGIGIMNIMLATVLERVKEIGLRRAIGAHKKDITLQFLFEALFICFIGGIIGVILGILSARIIANSADIPTVISWWSILLSFGVAFIVGLVFGLLPAKRAAEYDPIVALRTN